MSCSCSHLHGLTHISWMPVLKCSQCAHLYACAYTCVFSRACMCLHFNIGHVPYVIWICAFAICHVNIWSMCSCHMRYAMRIYIYAMCHADICHVPCARASRAWADETKVFQPYSKPESTKIHLLLCPYYYSTFSTKRKPLARLVDTLVLHYQCDIEFDQYGRGDIKPWHISFSPKHII